MDVLGWSQHSQYVQFAHEQSTLLVFGRPSGNTSYRGATQFLKPLQNIDAVQTVDGTNRQILWLFLWTFLPSGIALWAVVYDLLCSRFLRQYYPKTLIWLFNALRSPFTDFLSLDDLQDELGPVLSPPVWKHRLLVSLAVVQAWVWAAVAAYSWIVGEDGWWKSSAPAAGALLGWVSWSGSRVKVCLTVIGVCGAANRNKTTALAAIPYTSILHYEYPSAARRSHCGCA